MIDNYQAQADDFRSLILEISPKLAPGFYTCTEAFMEQMPFLKQVLDETGKLTDEQLSTLPVQREHLDAYRRNAQRLYDGITDPSSKDFVYGTWDVKHDPENVTGKSLEDAFRIVGYLNTAYRKSQ